MSDRFISFEIIEICFSIIWVELVELIFDIVKKKLLHYKNNTHT